MSVVASELAYYLCVFCGGSLPSFWRVPVRSVVKRADVNVAEPAFELRKKLFGDSLFKLGGVISGSGRSLALFLESF